MVLLKIVGVSMTFRSFYRFIVARVITLVAYSADLVRTFPDGIHLFGAFSAGSDEGFSAPSTCKCQKSPSGGVGAARVCSATSEASLGRSVASPRLGVKTQ